jgi:hypothetical protein
MMRGRTDEQRYAILSPYFDGRIKRNGPYPEVTNVSFLAKLSSERWGRIMAQLFTLSYSDAVSFRDIRGHLGTIPSIVTFYIC